MENQRVKAVIGTRRHPGWLRLLIIMVVASLIGWLGAMYWPAHALIGAR